MLTPSRQHPNTVTLQGQPCSFGPSAIVSLSEQHPNSVSKQLSTMMTVISVVVSSDDGSEEDCVRSVSVLDVSVATVKENGYLKFGFAK